MKKYGVACSKGVDSNADLLTLILSQDLKETASAKAEECIQQLCSLACGTVNVCNHLYMKRTAAVPVLNMQNLEP